MKLLSVNHQSIFFQDDYHLDGFDSMVFDHEEGYRAEGRSVLEKEGKHRKT